MADASRLMRGARLDARLVVCYAGSEMDAISGMKIRWTTVLLFSLCALGGACRNRVVDRVAIGWDTSVTREPPPWVTSVQALGLTLRSEALLFSPDRIYGAALWMITCAPNMQVDERVIKVLVDYVQAGGKLLCVVQSVPESGEAEDVEAWWVNKLGGKLGFKVLAQTTRKPRNLAPDLLGDLGEIQRSTWAAREIRLTGPGTVLVADDDLRGMAAMRKVGKGRVAIVGHPALLEENPALARNLLWTLAGAEE